MNVMINYTGVLGAGWTLATTRKAIDLFVARVRTAYPRATIAINETPGRRRQFEMRVDSQSLSLTHDPETATPDELKIGDIWNTTINELSL